MARRSDARPSGVRRARAAVVAVKARRPFRVVVTDGRGRPRRASGLCRWLVSVAPATARGELAVALVSDGKMRALNLQFRGVDRPTDVLSFPAERVLTRPASGPRVLGDVVIATGVARRQAHAAGHDMSVELRRLALHGLLHLLGYDHTRDAGRMARFEQRLLRKGGIVEGST